MERDLNQLKEKLWETLEEAFNRHASYSDPTYGGSSNAFSPKIENRNAIANLASAIVAVEKEIREREDANKYGAKPSLTASALHPQKPN